MKDKEKEKSSQEKTLNRQNLKIKQNQTQEIDLFEKNFETGKNFDYYFPQNNLKNILEKVDILYTYNRKLKKKIIIKEDIIHQYYHLHEILF